MTASADETPRPKKGGQSTGKSAIKAAMDAAQEAAPLPQEQGAPQKTGDAKATAAAGGKSGGKGKPAPEPDDARMSPEEAARHWTPPVLPEDSPVTPLGAGHDGIHVLNHDRMLAFVPYEKIKKDRLIGLFGDVQYLVRVWPNWTGKGAKAKLTWDHAVVSEAVNQACQKAGPFEPRHKVRGRGAWRGANGELILHLGNRLAIAAPPEHKGQPVLCGRWGAHVYPRALADPIPAPKPLTDPDTGEDLDDAGELILNKLSTWAFARGRLDARLLLGWLAAAKLGGALPWRPMVWLTGDSGTGKSTLQGLVKAILHNGVIDCANTTAAGIYQTTGADTLPVAFDEAEPDGGGGARMRAIIQLARQAASGNQMLRGSAGGQALEFQLRNCFLFSSVLVPPLEAQDRNRLAILELNALPRTADKEGDVRAAEEARDVKAAVAWGRALTWRLMREWPRYEATLIAFKIALAKAGHNARGQDQFGALLACADMALNSSVPTADDIERDGWVAQLNAADIAETREADSNWRRCLTHLGSSQLDAVDHGRRYTLNGWLSKILDEVDGERKPGEAPQPQSGKEIAKHSVQANLAAHGLRLLRDPDGGRRKDGEIVARLKGDWLAVANHHVGLAKLFQGTDWEQGVWKQALLRVDGALSAKKRIDGDGGSPCVLVPLSVMRREEEGE